MRSRIFRWRTCFAMRACWTKPQCECDRALAIDPTNYTWRSCAFAFFEQGKEARAMEYLKLDAGSE